MWCPGFTRQNALSRDGTARVGPRRPVPLRWLAAGLATFAWALLRGAAPASAAFPDLDRWGPDPLMGQGRDMVARVFYGERSRLAELAGRYDMFEFADHEQGYVLARLSPAEWTEAEAAGLRLELDVTQTAALPRSTADNSSAAKRAITALVTRNSSRVKATHRSPAAAGFLALVVFSTCSMAAISPSAFGLLHLPHPAQQKLTNCVTARACTAANRIT